MRWTGPGRKSASSDTASSCNHRLHAVEELYDVVWDGLGRGDGAADGLEPDVEALADAIDVAVKQRGTTWPTRTSGGRATWPGPGALDGARKPDPRRLRAALVQINRLLTTYLDRVNGWIVQRVKAMELGRAVDALRAIDGVLTRARWRRWRPRPWRRSGTGR